MYQVCAGGEGAMHARPLPHTNQLRVSAQLAHIFAQLLRSNGCLVCVLVCVGNSVFSLLGFMDGISLLYAHMLVT